MKVTTDACLFGSWISKNIPVQFPQKVLDIGTGTGLLSLMLAQKQPNFIIDAVELDIETTKQARENVAESPWSARINVIQTDVRKLKSTEAYDMIISNPPFYENELKSEVENKNIALHSKALTFSELIKVTRQQLKPAGRFFFLLPYKRFDEFRKILSGDPFTILNVSMVKQSVSHNYFRVMIEGKKSTGSLSEIAFEELSICNEHQQYTKEFVCLLKDYYLNL